MPFNIKPMPDFSPEQYGLFSLGFGPRTQAILRMVLERYGNSQFVFSSVEDGAEILIANGDVPGIADAIRQVRNTKPYPTIILSTILRNDIPDSVCLLNPLPPRLLIDTLQKIVKKILASRSKAPSSPSWQNEPEPAAGELWQKAAATGSPVSVQDIPAPLHNAPKLRAKSRNFSFSPEEIERAKKESEHEKIEKRKTPKINQAAQILEGGMSSPDNRGGFLHDIDLHDAAQLKNIYFQPEGFLSEFLRKMRSVASDDSFLLEIGIGSKRLVIDFESNRWGGDFEEQELRALCLGPLQTTLRSRWVSHEKAVQKEIIQRGKLEMVAGQTGIAQTQQIASHRKQRAEFILAQIGLWCSNGRLPEGTDVHAPIKLRYWPNMPHLPRTPGAMRIAAIWMQQPCSLAETVRLTGLMQRQIFAFYVICHTLCLLTTSQNTADQAHQNSPVPNKGSPLVRDEKSVEKKGFLRRLLSLVWSDDTGES